MPVAANAALRRTSSSEEMIMSLEHTVAAAQIDVTTNVYTEVSEARTLKALKRLGRQAEQPSPWAVE
jgi:hypothetical protein